MEFQQGQKLHALHFVVLWRQLVQVCPGMYYIFRCAICHGVTVGGMLWGKVKVYMFGHIHNHYAITAQLGSS